MAGGEIKARLWVFKITDSLSVQQTLGRVKSKGLTTTVDTFTVANEVGQTTNLELSDGCRTFSINLSGNVHTTGNAAWSLLKQNYLGTSNADNITVELSNADMTISGTCFVKSLDQSAGTADVVAFNATLVLDSIPVVNDGAQYTISGTILSNGNPFAGVTVNLTGAATATTTTDANGDYSFSGLAAGSYTITPVPVAPVVFTPTSISLTITTLNATNEDFAYAVACPTLTYTPQAPAQQQQFSGPSIPASASQGSKRTLSMNEAGTLLASGVPAHSTAPAGRVNTFTRSGSTFTFSQALTNPWTSAAAADNFGGAVSMSRDGVWMAVGSSGETGTGTPATKGRVAVYKNTAGVFAKTQDFGPSDNPAAGNFGVDVAISGDGLLIAVGNSTAAKCYLYKQTAGTYAEIKILTPSEASGGSYGIAVDLSANGLYLAIGDKGNDTGGTDKGVVYIYNKDQGGIDNWGLQQVIHAGGSWAGSGWFFGSDVALSCDGTYLAAGAEGVNRTTGSAPGGLNEGSMEIWVRSGSTWTLRAAVVDFNDTLTTGSGLCGESVEITGDGAQAYMGGSTGDHGTTDSGIIERAVWSPSVYTPAVTVPSVRAASDFFGKSMVLSGDGKHLVVGAPGNDTFASGAGCLFYFLTGV